MFRGYLKWNPADKGWNDDEWLCSICGSRQGAKEQLREFAEGRPFDDYYEEKVTRYFRGRTNPFVRGTEVEKDDPDKEETQWMRYAKFTVADIRTGEEQK